LEPSASADQSVGFRILLWRSAAILIERNPAGTGIGTFGVFSAQPGLVTHTKLSHQTYLESAEEASPVAALLLISIGVVWVWSVWRASNGESDDNYPLIAGIAFACIAVLLHSFLDSDLSSYGIGLVLFMLLGTGARRCAEGGSLIGSSRRVALATASMVTLLATTMAYFGIVEALRGQAASSFRTHLLPEARIRLSDLRRIAPWDPEVLSLSTEAGGAPRDRLRFALKAVELSPTTRNLRLLARVQSSDGQFSAALATLNQAVALDPNNLPMLLQRCETLTKAGWKDEYIRALNELIMVETTTAYRIRSMPELVPTETFVARIRLAALTPSTHERIRLLRPAVAGFKLYAAETLPIVFQQSGSAAAYGVDSVGEAKAKMALAESGAARLASDDTLVGDSQGAAAASGDSDLFDLLVNRPEFAPRHR
jgi:hypothetical protein